MKKLGIGLVILSLFVGLFGWTAAEAAAPSFTCTGGAIPGGTYSSLTIMGFCSITTGAVIVKKGVVVNPSASLNALGLAGGTLTVGRNIVVGNNAILVLGCGVDTGCTVPVVDHVSGSILASQALSVILHNDTVGGDVVINAGGGGLTCTPNAALVAILGVPNTPPYDDISDLTIGGNVTVTDVKSCWMGIIRNTVTSNVTVRHNAFVLGDADEIVTNTIGKTLACSGNAPAPQVGDSGGSPNVAAKKLGQCLAPGL